MTPHFGYPLEAVLIFLFAVCFSVYLDLFAHRKHQAITLKNAIGWSLFWVCLALAFYAYLWLRFDNPLTPFNEGKEWADLYLAGYALEKALSIDNLMLFMAIFASFGIQGPLQHRILYFGIIGALAFRAVFVLIGAELFLASPLVGFVFAIFVIWSGVKMLQKRDHAEEIQDYSHHWSVNLVGKLMPVYPRLYDENFFVSAKHLGAEALSGIKKSAWYITPAFLCLIAIETSDVAFAFDSVPAVIAVTQEPLLVYAAMIFAVLGLRSLYFVLAALTRYLVHLEKAVICLLFFIGAKMALQSWNHAIEDTGIHISPGLSLAIVLGTLSAGIVASLIFPNKKKVA